MTIAYSGGRPAKAPDAAGIGFKSQHADLIMSTLPQIAFLEIHAENYFGDGGPPHRRLAALAEHYPISVHGVGLSLGSRSIDSDHLDSLARVVERVNPALVSEHLAWAQVDGVWMNDLLPIPYTPEALDRTADNIARTQDRLGRTLLIENPSACFAWAQSSIPEPEFLSELCKRTGCGILLDVNNLYVSAANLGLDPTAYLDGLPMGSVGQYHLAGHHARTLENGAVLRIDDHGSRVIDPVWALYRQAVKRFGRRPTLIEWDTDVPPLDVLLAEAVRADAEAEDAHAHCP